MKLVDTFAQGADIEKDIKTSRVFEEVVEKID